MKPVLGMRNVTSTAAFLFQSDPPSSSLPLPPCCHVSADRNRLALPQVITLLEMTASKTRMESK